MFNHVGDTVLSLGRSTLLLLCRERRQDRLVLCAANHFEALCGNHRRGVVRDPPLRQAFQKAAEKVTGCEPAGGHRVKQRRGGGRGTHLCDCLARMA